MKLKFKLSIIVIMILVAVVGGLSTLILTQAASMVLNLSRASMVRLTEKEAAYLQGREEGYLRVAHVMAGFMGNFELIEPEQRRDQFDQFMQATLSSEPNLVGIFAIFKPNALDGLDAQYRGAPGSTAEGIYAPLFSRTSGQVERQTYDAVPTALELINGPNNRQSVIRDPVPQVVKGKNTYTIRFGVPIINNSNNQVIGLAGINLQIDAMQPLIEKTLRENKDISTMAVYAGDGTIIGSYKADRVGKNVRQADARLYEHYLDKAVDTIMAPDKTTQLQVYSDDLKTNLELVLVSFPIAEAGSWTVMIGTPENVILQNVHNLTRIVIIISVLMAVVVAGIISFVLSSTVKPIINVVETLKDISEGEGDLTRTVDVHSQDEIGDLARYFNKTLAKIKNLVVTIKHQAVALFDIGNELVSNMTETATVIHEITTHIQNIKGRVINQSASVTETNATMEQITGNIDKLNDHIENQTSSVSKSSSAIEEMIANINAVTQTLVRNAQSVQDLLESSDVGRTGLQEVATDIQEIARESEGLLEINAVMENIASQTNLLSMNAAIEAAHAGEAGKGFAVVADEIRKLAENSSEQSKTISTVLKKIKESIDKIIKSTDAVLNKFEAIDGGVKMVSEQTENIRNAMEEQSVGSKQILEVMGQLSQITQMVKGGSEEMLEGSKEVILEAKNLEMATQEITNGMNEMATGADQMNIAVKRVNEICGENKESINVLVKEVSRFKVE
ncbi:MAG: methyl-accepting chemotaxis protein [Treponema sp.]|jgi:methyl-accepting chemotaxis protein|nr:methyl-accepting chemotaxis protein [Treponema sp.]